MSFMLPEEKYDICLLLRLLKRCFRVLDTAAMNASAPSTSNDASQTVKHLLEEIADVSAQNEAIKAREAICDEQIVSLNHAIRLLCDHFAPAKRRQQKGGRDKHHHRIAFDITPEILPNSALGTPHCPCLRISITNNTLHELDASHWSCEYRAEVLWCLTIPCRCITDCRKKPLR